MEKLKQRVNKLETKFYFFMLIAMITWLLSNIFKNSLALLMIVAVTWLIILPYYVLRLSFNSLYLLNLKAPGISKSLKYRILFSQLKIKKQVLTFILGLILAFLFTFLLPNYFLAFSLINRICFFYALALVYLAYAGFKMMLISSIGYEAERKAIYSKKLNDKLTRLALNTLRWQEYAFF